MDLFAQMQAQPGGVPPLIAVPALLGAAAVIWMFRGSLTPAIGQAVVIATISVAILAAVGTNPLDIERPGAATITLAGLAVLWLVAGEADRTGVTTGFGLCCWAAAAAMLATRATDGTGDAWALALLGAPVVLAVLRGRIAAAATASIVLCVIQADRVEAVLGRFTPMGYVTPQVMLAAAGLSLLITIGAALRGFGVRRRVWLNDPSRLLNSPRPPLGIAGLVLVIAAVVTLASVMHGLSALTGPSALVASFAVLGMSHMRSSRRGATIGLLLLAYALFLIGRAWIPAAPAYALAAIIGAYMLWLARFWTQQLNDGNAWTTAGGLVPVARIIARALAVAAAVAAVVAAADSHFHPAWSLLPLAFAFLLLRDGFDLTRPMSAVFAIVAATAAAFGAAPAGVAFSPLVTPFTACTAVVSLLAFRLGVARTGQAPAAVALVATIPPALILLHALANQLDAAIGLAAVFWAAAVSLLAWPKRDIPAVAGNNS